MTTKDKKIKKELYSAEIRSLISKNKSWCLKRIFHDYEEIKNQTVPIPGVVALPLASDMHIWHGNIKCLKDSIYKGAVLHFQINFPKDYPLSPPKITLLSKSNIVHPNIIGIDNTICLDILQKKTKKEDIGWNSGYTILSALSQLQNFFFDPQKRYLLNEFDEKREIETFNKKKKEIEDKEKKEREEKKKNNEEYKAKEYKESDIYVPPSVKTLLEYLSSFKCYQCDHKGTTDPYPKFPEDEKLNTKLTSEQYQKEKNNEICCCYTRENFEKCSLGLGINISLIPRTGELKNIEPCYDFIALKTFTKERIRADLNGKIFTHWFPLYFGQQEKKVSFLKKLKKTLSMICKGNTKEFSPDLILKAMTVLFNSCCLSIVKETVHNSTRTLEVLLYIYREIIMLINEFPDIKKEVNKKLDNFIKLPEERIKEKTPSLGDILVMLCISDHTIEEFLPAYMSEQMDRQVFWTLNLIPNFKELLDQKEIDDVKAKICFKAGIVSKQLLLFYYYFLKKIVYAECKTLDKFAEKLDKNNGSLSEKEIYSHKKEIDKLLKIDNFDDYFKFMGLSVPSLEDLNNKLNKAFENSEKKGYHGFDKARFVPAPEEQIKEYMKKYELFDKLFEGGKISNEENINWEELLNCFDIVKQYKYAFPNKKLASLDLIRFYREKMSEKLFFEINFNHEKNKKKETKDNKDNNLNNQNEYNKVPYRGGGRRRRNNRRYRGNSQQINTGAGLFNPKRKDSPRRREDERRKYGSGFIRGEGRGGRPFSRGERRIGFRGFSRLGRGGKEEKDRRNNSSKVRTINEKNHHIETPPVITDNLEVELKVNKRKYIKKLEDEEIIEKLSLKQLCLKLYLEEYCKYFNYIGNFKRLYDIVDAVKNDLPHFSLVINNIGFLTSDFNYVRGILSRLTSIKYLELVFTSNITKKLLRNLVKGINNNLKGKGAIEHLKLILNPNIKKCSTKELNLLTIIDNMPSIKILDLSGVALDSHLIQRVKNHLYYYKKIRVLDLSYCKLDDNLCNELADGIMKAKSLEKLYFAGNNTNKGISSIIYNLAFQPAIKLIDISYNNTCDVVELASSLYKFIKMSQSIETIIANNIPQLNNSFTKDFYSTLGDNIYLTYLDLSNNGKFTSSNLNQFGMSIAFNSLKNGSLSYIDISYCVHNYSDFKGFINSMSISDSDHNDWYGFQFDSSIPKDKPEYYKKKFNCKLKSLIVKGVDLYCHTNYLLPINADAENPMKTLINESNNLDTLIFNNGVVNKYFIDSISLAMKKPNKIVYLSFSNCSMRADALKALLPSFYENDLKITKKKKKNKKKELISNANFHIEGLDISCNNLTYGAIESLCQVLEINKTITYLNLFHNKLDVSGAKRIGEYLKKNNKLIELDLGYNRIKGKGFEQLINLIIENKDSSLKKLGVKYNFINNDDLKKVFGEIGKCDKISLEEIELKNNSFVSSLLPAFNEEFKKINKNITIDILDVLYYLEPERIQRTIWLEKDDKISYIDIFEKIYTLEKDFIAEQTKADAKIEPKDICYVGIPLSMVKIRGRKTGKSKENSENNAFVEFICPNSVNRIMSKSSSLNLHGPKNKVFKAGTRLKYFVVKPRKIIEEEEIKK